MTKKNNNKLTDERTAFKPFAYPWAYESWLKHEQSHWLHTEVPMLEDVKDWKNKLTQEEKNFLTHIFRTIRASSRRPITTTRCDSKCIHTKW